MKKIILLIIFIITLAFAENPYNKYIGKKVEIQGVFILCKDVKDPNLLGQSMILNSTYNNYINAQSSEVEKYENIFYSSLDNINKTDCTYNLSNQNMQENNLIAKVIGAYTEVAEGIKGFGDGKDKIFYNARLRILRKNKRDYSKKRVYRWTIIYKNNSEIIK